MFIGVVDGALTSELRRSVLRPNFPVGALMPADLEAGALHVAALDDDGVPLSACALFVRPFVDGRPGWQLRGMATAESARNTGVGGLVVEAAAAELISRGADLLWCHARERAIPFYLRHQFVGTGGIFVMEETGIPHLLMSRELLTAPTSSDG